MLSTFDPLVAEWFADAFRQAHRAADRRAGREIRAGRDVLISAPTGSGKTLAAFLTAIDRLVAQARAGHAAGRDRKSSTSRRSRRSATTSTRTWKSRWPGSRQLAAERGIALAPIRTAVRTGDTPAVGAPADDASEPPHILVTTPESLYILLTAERPARDAAQRAHGDRG